MSAKYKSPSFLLPNELNTSTNPSLSADRASMYSMNANGSYISLGTLLNLGTDNTICMWIKPKTASLAGSLLASSGFNDSYAFFDNTQGSLIPYWGVTPVPGYGSTFTDFYTKITDSSVINTWQFMVLMRTSTSMKVYLYNSNYSSTPFTETETGYPSTGDSTINYINSRPNGTSNLNADLDEFSFFNKVLTDAQINSLYNSGSPASAAITINLGAIAYYPLGEQAQNTGYLGNEITNGWQFPNGVLQDYVMDFDGSTDFIDTNLTIDSTYSALTISAWVNFDNLTNYSTVLGQWRNGSFPNSTVLLYLDNTSKIQVLFGSGSSYVSAGLNTTLQTNRWYNLIVLWDGSTVKLYVDGSVQSTTGSLSSLNNSDVTLKIGSYNEVTGSGTRNYIDGKISNVVVWNSDQSANIANIYNNGSPQKSYTVSPQNWWKLNATSVYTPSAPNYTTALDFNGSSRVSAPLNNVFNSATQSTISFWAKKSSSSNEIVLGAGTAETNSIYILWYSNGYVYFGTRATGAPTFNINEFFSGSDKLNKWHHFVGVYNAGTASLYINGSLASGPTSGGPSSLGSNIDSTFAIGRLGDVTTYNSTGEMSNVAIFNSALTASQVSTLFNFGTPETAISFSPVGWWKLDNTTTGIQDSSGSGNNGTNNGATDATTSVAVVPSWKIPSALTVPEHNYLNVLNFNSSQSDYINTASNVGISGSQSRTMSVWLKGGSANNGKNWPMAVAFGANSANKAMWIGGGGSGAAYWYFGWWSTDLATNIRMDADNDWHLLTSTYDGTTAKGYIDGVEVISGARTINTTDSPLIIGKHLQDSTYWDGPISNVSIWNTALSDAQVSTLYNNGKPETAISFSPIGWWKLDSATITDSAGSNNGTNNGAEVEVSNVIAGNIPVNGVSTTLPSTALQQSDLQFDSPYSNYSLNFDGSTNYIEIDSIGPTISAMTEISISTWIKTTATTSGYVFFAGKYVDGYLGYFVRNTGILSGVVDLLSGNLSQVESTVTVNDGSWHNIILTFTNSSQEVKIYIDGLLNNSHAGTGTIPTNIIYADIGQRSYNNDFRFNGKIDETSIFNYSLSEAQILEIYNNGKPGNLSNYSGTAPISWCRLGENAYFDNNAITIPNSISGAPNGTGPGTVVNMLSADAPGTYANGIGTNLDIIDRVGDAALSASNSQSYNMIPSDKSPYVPQYVGKQIANNFSMTFDAASNTSFNAGNTSVLSFERTNPFTISAWIKTNATSTQVILNKLISNVGYQFFINSTGKLCFYSQQSSSVYIQKNSTAAFNNNSWQHVVVTYDGSSNRSGILLYANGNATATTDVGSASLNATIINTASVNIGSSFTGQIDEVAIFDTALNAGQIYNDIYQPTATGTNQTADLVNNPNLPNPVAWYRMGD